MKRWIQFGLLIAAAMAALLVWWNMRQAQRPSSRPEVQTNLSEAATDAQRGRARSSITNFTSRPAFWASLEAADTARFIANLRQIGCPEQTIREIVTFRICREFRRRLIDLESQWAQSWDYTQNFDSFTAQERRRQREELADALDKELETLFGVSAGVLKSSMTGWRGFPTGYEFLPLPKQAVVNEIDRRYRYLTEDARRGLASWEVGSSEETRVNELNQQKQTELANVLTRQELEALNLRESPAARYVRENLPEAKSEDDFRKMVQAVQEVGIETPKIDPFLGQYGLAPGLTAHNEAEESPQATKEAQLQTRLKQLLGERRFAELERAEQARLTNAPDQ
jgi:hypothetical protein